jgi:ATP-dependent DNA helicase DinG
LNREISFAVYKGVGNYLCLQKMSVAEEQPDGEILLEISSLERDAKRLRDWAAKPGISGDRDDAPDVDRRVWLANSTSGRECLGAEKCAFGVECFAVRAKARAQASDIVVTNHTLLAIEIVDSHPILPERDAVILDEAHEFMDRTTQAVTEELTAGRVTRAATMLRRHMPGKLAETFYKAGENFGESLSDFLREFAVTGDEERRLTELPDALFAPVRKLKEAAESVVSAINADETIIDPDALAERARVKGAINEIKTTSSKLLKSGEGNVLWIEPNFATLYLAPLEVSTVLRENLFSKSPVIATSATLTVGNSFNSISKNLGIYADPELDEGNDSDLSFVQTLDVGSPFDFANQGMLYLPRNLPEPGRDGPSKEALIELGELIDAAGGRTLALFSSWRGVEMADEHLRRVLAELPIQIITQRRGDSAGALVERFAEEPTSILLGTLSLWQGVDVPGPSCTLVAIDRIPFPRPDDPVLSARAKEIDAAGGSGFMEVSLPRAALLLAQGTGRLIRSIDDRGVVAILDSRIVTRRYGSLLLNSMPPLWRTSDGQIVKESLRRLHNQFQ